MWMMRAENHSTPIDAIMKILSCILVALVAHTMALPFEGRIVGGQNAYRGQFKHQISMRINNQHFCGGSIIGPTTILTAAHCISGNNNPMQIVAGVTNLNEGGQRRNVIYRVAHPSYNPHELSNDVAILKLDSPLQTGDGLVEIIPLRSNPSNGGETLTLSGWGLTSTGGQIPDDLQYINLGAIDLQTCARLMSGAGNMPVINTGQVCTQSPNGQGACQGDSGGPLIDGNGQQIGVVSWGIPCAQGFPDIFTSVPFFLSWIQSQ